MKHDWVKAIGKKLREDLGDCPTLPQELLEILGRLDQLQFADKRSGKTAGSTAAPHASAPHENARVHGASGQRRNV